MLYVRLVGRVARLVSILAMYDRSRLFSTPFHTERPHFLSLGLVVAPVPLEYWGNSIRRWVSKERKLRHRPPVQMNADLSTTARASLFFSIALSTKPTLPPIFRRPGRTQLAGLTIPRRLAWPTALLVPLLALYLEPLPGS